MPKLLILDRQAAIYHQYIREAGLGDLDVLEASDPGALPLGTEQVHIALGPPDLLAAAIPAMPALRWAQSTWAGVEPLLGPDLPRNYLLSGVKGVFGEQMAEYCLCYMLAHERQVIERYRSQQRGVWQHDKPGRLAGKHAVLLGLGSIGREIAVRCRQFGMATTAVTLSGRSSEHVDACFPVQQLPAVAARADYLVMSLPGTPSTRQLVDAAVLGVMPRHALVINVGRGQCLDEHALDTALRDGSLGGAVLDVFETEPLPRGHFLWSTPRLQISSHTAAVSYVEDIAPLFVANLQRFLAGQVPDFLVDFKRGY
ncbi:MAG: D-2-hydroxyacid dehydrogenase [Gammaproteobacteria bacterium]|nr:D-2-hydroxyacid dehydrogenase [Gammaproteobacteria bacterium]